jgi:hypothetical protein
MDFGKISGTWQLSSSNLANHYCKSFSDPTSNTLSSRCRQYHVCVNCLVFLLLCVCHPSVQPWTIWRPMKGKGGGGRGVVGRNNRPLNIPNKLVFLKYLYKHTVHKHTVPWETLVDRLSRLISEWSKIYIKLYITVKRSILCCKYMLSSISSKVYTLLNFVGIDHVYIGNLMSGLFSLICRSAQ